MPQGNLGPYTLGAVLGRGGMGTVYRARLREPRLGLDRGELVALKVVHSGLLGSPTLKQRLDREARLGVQVTHPNVVRAFGQETIQTEDQVHHVLVMEHVEGQTLRALLEEVGRVPESLVRTIGRAMTRGLAAIHAAGAVHRDLKPENALITPDHQVKIMDLGVAHIQNELVRLTQSESFAGSVEYAAPEQFLGTPGSPDGRSDLFTLGLLLYELVTGDHPFRRENPRQVLRAILDEQPRKAGDVNPQISPFLEEVLTTLLAKQPEARFATAEDLLQVLEEGESSAWWTQRAHALRRSMRRPLRRTQVPHETAVFGRENELAALRDAFNRASDEEGQVVLVRGEAGIGKTRLVDELVRRLAQEGNDVDFLAGAYTPGTLPTVHGAFSTAFRERLGAEDLRAVLCELFSEDWFLLPAFAALLTGEPRPPDAPPLSRDSVHAAFATITRKLSQECPLILFIDDLHNAPEEARVLFSDLAHAIRGQRVLLIGCGRRRLPAAWVADMAAQPHVRQFELERLGAADLHRLLGDALGATRAVRDLEPTIALKSEGNPYFVFEILRSLREQGRITRRPDGSWTASGRTDVVEIPSSVHDLIQARLEGLEEVERELLEVGACCGFTFDPVLVADVTETDRIQALRALGRIEASRRLVRSQERTFAFDHHQVMEVLYAGLSPMLREEYHGVIADRLVRGMPSQGAEGASGQRAMEVCRHALRSARPDILTPCLSAALDHLQDGYQGAEAIRLMEDVLARPGLLTGERRFALLMRQNGALGLRGRREAQARALDQAEQIAERIGEHALRLQVHLARAHLMFDQGRLEEAMRFFETARSAASAHGDRSGEARAQGGLGLVAYRQGRLQDARRHFEQNYALAETRGKSDATTSALGNLGVVLQALGLHDEALECLQQVLATARSAGDLRLEGKSCDNLGILLQQLGRVDEARRSYARAVELADRVGDRMSQAVGRVNLGSMLREHDRLAEAVDCLQAALEIGTEIDDPINQAISLDNLGVAALSLGNHTEARVRLDAALALCRRVGSKQDESYVLENLGRLAEDEGRLADAVNLLEQAVALRQEIGYPIGEASALAHLGRVLARRGDGKRATEVLDAAIEMATVHASPTILLRALAKRSALPGGSVETLQEALAQYRGHVEREDEMRALFALWKATGDVESLEAVRRLLADRIALAPAQDRQRMQDDVGLHRAILEADEQGALPTR